MKQVYEHGHPVMMGEIKNEGLQIGCSDEEKKVADVLSLT